MAGTVTLHKDLAGDDLHVNKLHAATHLPNGTDPIPSSWKGAYDNLASYIVGDQVSYNGSSYINILACTHTLPTVTANWSVMAAASEVVTVDGGTWPPA
jgi:hypothetical protein